MLIHLTGAGERRFNKKKRRSEFFKLIDKLTEPQMRKHLIFFGILILIYYLNTID